MRPERRRSLCDAAIESGLDINNYYASVPCLLRNIVESILIAAPGVPAQMTVRNCFVRSEIKYNRSKSHGFVFPSRKQHNVRKRNTTRIYIIFIYYTHEKTSETRRRRAGYVAL